MGTAHVSSYYPALCSSAAAGAAAVVLECCEERFHQADIRLSHLRAHDTASLVAVSWPGALDGPAWRVTDVLAWPKLRAQYRHARHEGTAALLGTIYAGDIVGAALAADAAGADIVLADRPHHHTTSRLQALIAALDWVPEQSWEALGGAGAGGPALTVQGPDGAWQVHALLQHELGQLLLRAWGLAGARLGHLLQQWASMVAVGRWGSRPQWYAEHVHWAFQLGDPHSAAARRYLVRGNAQAEAAAAAVQRLLEHAASATGRLPAASDLRALRAFVARVEAQEHAARTSRLQQLLDAAPAPAPQQQEQAAGVQPWWQHVPLPRGTQQEQLPGSGGGGVAAGGRSDVLASSGQSSRQPAATASFAYERVVIQERDAILAGNMWVEAGRAAAAAAAAAEQGLGHPAGVPTIVGVVGAKHLPGVIAEWQRLQRVQALQAERAQLGAAPPAPPPVRSAIALAASAAEPAALPWAQRHGAVNAAAHALELGAVGVAGAAYYQLTSLASRGLAAAGMPRAGPCWASLCLWAVPAAAVALPLYIDASRMREAAALLHNVALQNDAMLRFAAK